MRSVRLAGVVTAVVLSASGCSPDVQAPPQSPGALVPAKCPDPDQYQQWSREYSAGGLPNGFEVERVLWCQNSVSQVAAYGPNLQTTDMEPMLAALDVSSLKSKDPENRICDASGTVPIVLLYVTGDGTATNVRLATEACGPYREEATKRLQEARWRPS